MQRVSPSLSRIARPAVGSRNAYAGTLGLALDETQDLRPRRPIDPPASMEAAVPARSKPRPSVPPPTRTEKTLRSVLLFGMGLTAAVLLTQGSSLPTADILLGTTILFAGTSLLVVMALSRR
ncbi:MAG TPA: hypothetical protein VLE27_10250 [Thermoanaerobaculia bacterium]|nr:hypothetical protein [Thermoanaerobaculia bacterium]